MSTQARTPTTTRTPCANCCFCLAPLLANFHRRRWICQGGTPRARRRPVGLEAPQSRRMSKGSSRRLLLQQQAAPTTTICPLCQLGTHDGRAAYKHTQQSNKELGTLVGPGREREESGSAGAALTLFVWRDRKDEYYDYEGCAQHSGGGLPIGRIPGTTPILARHSDHFLFST